MEENDEITEEEMVDILSEEVWFLSTETDSMFYDKFKSCRVRSFDEVGLLTHDNGFVIKLNDGSEYQITVVKSK